MGLALSFSTPIAAQGEVRITTWDGAQEEAQTKLAGVPFTAKTGIETVYATWPGTIAPIRAMVETKQVTMDTYPLNTWDVIVGCDEGILERLDPKELGLDSSDFYEGTIEPCGISSDLLTILWAWNLDRLPHMTGDNRPKSIAEAWDLKKFPGRTSRTSFI